MNNDLKCPFTGKKDAKLIFTYKERPPGEIGYPGTDGDYYREVWQFQNSKHYVTTHNMNLEALYTGDYVASTYGGMDGLRKTFKKVVSLPKENSDNYGRVERIDDFLEKHFSKDNKEVKVLDVGSGVGIYPYAMSEKGYNVTALDPDPTAAKHMSEDLNLNVICGDFFDVDPGDKYDFISFNKVLEHVEDPFKMLIKTKDIMNENSVVYFEVPDGEMASLDKDYREEFDIDHFHVFSVTSCSMLCDSVGLTCLAVERVREPSKKYTLRVFATLG